MSDTFEERKKPGPVPGPPTRKYNVLLDEALAEWGKHQPGGLSELLRRLLSAAYHEQTTSRRRAATQEEDPDLEPSLTKPDQV
jgi:hypothetical protein